MEKLYVIKIGGNIIDDEKALAGFLGAFNDIKGNKILVHGGGKLATTMGEALGIPQQIVDGRRITDAEMLKIITMVYAGYINKNITAKLQSLHCNAIGLSGADANLVTAHKRTGALIDYGFVGDIDAVNTVFLQQLLVNNMVPVLAPVTHDNKGNLLNTNADTMAREIARSLRGMYAITLVYCFEKNGVLADANDDDSAFTAITRRSFAALTQQGIISAGMIPKLENAFAALDAGVQQIVLGHANHLHQLIHQQSGTAIVYE